MAANDTDPTERWREFARSAGVSPAEVLAAGARAVAIRYAAGTRTDDEPEPDPTFRTLLADRHSAEPSVDPRADGHLATLLDAAVAAPDAPISTLPLLTAAEEAELDDWNATAVDYGDQPMTPELVDRRCARQPDAVAVAAEDGSLTGRELADRVARLAGHLAGCGIRAGDRVGVCLERSSELVVALLAVWRVGAAYVPLEPAYPAARLAFMAADAQLALVLSRSELAARLPSTGLPTASLDRDCEPVAAAAPITAGSPVSGSAPAYVIYTSGSTGQPKGVVNTHAGLRNRLLWMQEEYRLRPSDAVLQKTPCGFDVSVWEFFWPLLAGARLVMARPDGHRDPGYLAATIESERISVLHFVPSMLRVFLRAADLSRCGSLRQVVCSGEALPAALVGQFYDLLGPVAPAVRLDNLYGPTEAAIDVTRWACGPADAAADPVPIGTPIANTSTHVVDRYGNRMPVGCTGELLLGGLQVAAGYLGQPTLTAERFVPDPFSRAPDARLYRTGDLARRRSDGVLEYLGRIDDQVKLRGQRIELGEIEAQLRATPGVADAAVLLHSSPDAPGDDRLVAYVALATAETGATATLAEQLAERLPAPFVPAAFVALSALPLSPNGKTDRAALAALGADRPNPPATGDGQRGGSQSLAGAIPRQVARLWAEALGMAEPPPDAGFVQLGGHSLRAALLVARIRAELGVEVTVGAVLEAPTLTRFVADQVAPRLAGAAGRTTGPVARHQTSSPLSFAQHRLWFLHRMHPELTAYHLHVAWELTGELDLGALRAALEVVLRRHQVLRSGIEVDPAGEPVLVVRLASAAELPFTQVAEPSGLAAHLRASFDRPFDLAHGPLLRAELFGLEPRKQVLLLVVHHLAADEWTLGLLGAELSAAYSALAAGHPVELPDLPLQYGDYAHWQHTSLTSGALAGHREYWTRQLAGLEPLTVPPDRPRPPQQSFVGRRVGIWVPPELLAGLRAAARPQGGTDFMALIAGFLALLGRWTGRRDVAVGTVTADRRTADLHRLAGFFVNTVALRLDLSGDPSFEQLVRRVRDATTDAIEHQDLPFDQLMATAGATRDGSGAPLFGIAVSYLNTPPGEIGFRGLTAREVGVETGVVRFDLDVFMRERGGGIAVEVDYRVDLFDEVTICRLLDSYLRLLIAAARTPAAPLEAADLTGPEGWTELTTLGRRPAAHPAAPLVPDLIAEQARLRPGATAVRSTERVLRYAELDSESDRLADRLRALGAGRDRIVAVLLERSADFVVALLAVLKAGAGYLPLDPSLPDERLAELVADSGAPLAVSRTALAGRLGGTAATVVLIDASDRDAAGPEPATGPRPPIGAADLAYVIYTSGSTGRPKGVLVEHAGLANLCRWHINAYGLTPADRGTLVAAQAFDASVWELWPYLVAGAGVSIADEATRSDPDRIVRWLADQRATVAFLATPLAEAVLDGDQVRGLPLRFLLTGGDRLRRRPAPGLPFPVINHYGPTECTVVATAGTVADTEHGDGPPAIGRPIDNVEAYLLDDRRQPVRRGAVGELYLGGVQVARGYLNRPEPTARHFLDSPFGRLYRTGDLARWRNDGELEFLGRADRQIKIRGHRIEPGEIEVRLRAHPGVADTVVVAQPVDPRRPDGDRRLVAYLTAPPGPSPAPAELRRWLRERLPEHLVPTRFVLLDQWPMTPSGKIDQARLPPPADIAEDAAYVAPRDDVEREIAQLVADLLGRDRVGIRDGFFELGGDSLQAARLTARLYRAFGVELPVGAVFTGPTVEEMATALVTAALAEESGQGAGNGVVRQ